VVSDVGQAVLLLVAAGAAGAAIAIAVARSRTRDRRAALAELRAHLVPADALRDGARVAMRGRLTGPPGAAAVGLRLHGRDVTGGPPRTERSARRTPELALELAAKPGTPVRRIALDGPLSVLAGAEVIVARGRDVALIGPLHEDARALARQVPWTEGPAAVGSVGVEFTELHRVPVGSPVVVAGRLVLGPSAGEVGYRDAAGRWSLVGSDDAPIQLASERPGPRRAAGRWGIGFCLGVLAALAAMRLLSL
jgi:hypothetical protein